MKAGIDRAGKVFQLDKIYMASAWFRQCRKSDVALRFQLGMACLKLGPDQEASHWLQGILWKQPDHLPTLTALADYYQSKGNRKMAELYRRKAQKPTGKDISQAPESVRK